AGRRAAARPVALQLGLEEAVWSPDRMMRRGLDEDGFLTGSRVSSPGRGGDAQGRSFRAAQVDAGIVGSARHDERNGGCDMRTRLAGYGVILGFVAFWRP